MPLSDDKAAEFAKAIADTVPLFLLAEVVDEQGVVADFDSLRKAGSGTPDKDNLALAKKIVDAYNAVGLAHRLAESLYRRGRRDDVLAEAISPFATDTNNLDAAKQAALVLRAVTLPWPELRKFMDVCEPCVCVVAGIANIAGEPTPRIGTGFLVGPDLVLTARHVLDDFIDRGSGKAVDPKQASLFAFFDHLEGEPITDPDDDRIRARRVPFADDWLVHTSAGMPGDGLIANPTPDQIAKLKVCLDLALVRLADPIGLYTRAKAGGTQRQWLPLNGVAGNLRKHDRIIIPQHPHGHTLQIDVGRLDHIDQSATRIRYDTGTLEGSSGAPCFNQRFTVVGLHNAAYKPNGVAIFNQAVRFDLVAASILAGLNPAGPNPAGPTPAAPKPAGPEPANLERSEPEGLERPNKPDKRMWSVSPDYADPHVILGRTAFLDWITKAAVELTTQRADRVYAAAATVPRAGRSFSIEILQAARRNKSEPIVKLGIEKKDQVPATVHAFLAAIADQLRIPQSALEGMPPRSEENMPAASKDGDKLNKWASEEVPHWFDGVLGKHRESLIDQREKARQILKLLEEANLERPPEVVKIANSEVPVPDTRNRAPLTWIVLDNLTKDSLSKDVADLIAGLCGDRAEEAAVPMNLRRLRWLFLGHKLDFVIDTQACVEQLDPMKFGADAMMDFIAGLAAAFNTELSDSERNGVKRTFKAMEVSTPTLQDPLLRLETLQKLLNAFALDFLQDLPEKGGGG